MEIKRKRRLEYVKVAPFSRCSTGLQVLFRDDQVAIQPTMITLPYVFLLSPASLLSFPLPLHLASSALSKISFFLSYRK